MNRRLGVLISGRGSNLQALIDAIADGRLDAIDRGRRSPTSRMRPGSIARAQAGIETVVLESSRLVVARRVRSRARARAAARESGWCASPASCACSVRRCSRRFPNAILNIHPSLLPAFPGVDAQRQALEHGVKVSGVTVHLVDDGARRRPDRPAARPCRCVDDDTRDTLAARILVEEHRVYPEAVQLVLDGGWRVEGRRFVEALATLIAARRRKRQDRDLGRAVDAHRHIDRADATAHEDRRVALACQARQDGELASARSRRGRAGRPGRRACVPTAPPARRAPPLRSAAADRAPAGATCRPARRITRAMSAGRRVQNRMPARSSVSPRIVSCVR